MVCSHSHPLLFIIGGHGCARVSSVEPPWTDLGSQWDAATSKEVRWLSHGPVGWPALGPNRPRLGGCPMGPGHLLGWLGLCPKAIALQVGPLIYVSLILVVWFIDVFFTSDLIGVCNLLFCSFSNIAYFPKIYWVFDLFLVIMRVKNINSHNFLIKLTFKNGILWASIYRIKNGHQLT